MTQTQTFWYKYHIKERLLYGFFIFFLQARYRQYFEEDLADSNNDAEAMIPMETQVLMQEVLTDGMAFCSLMWSPKNKERI